MNSAGKHTFLCLTNNSRLQVDEDGARHVLASARLAEEGIEGVIATSDGFVRRHLPVWLNAVFQAVQLPAGVTDLHASLANVDRNTLTL